MIAGPRWLPAPTPPSLPLNCCPTQNPFVFHLGPPCTTEIKGVGRQWRAECTVYPASQRGRVLEGVVRIRSLSASLITMDDQSWITQESWSDQRRMKVGPASATPARPSAVVDPSDPDLRVRAGVSGCGPARQSRFDVFVEGSPEDLIPALRVREQVWQAACLAGIRVSTRYPD